VPQAKRGDSSWIWIIGSNAAIIALGVGVCVGGKVAVNVAVGVEVGGSGLGAGVYASLRIGFWVEEGVGVDWRGGILTSQAENSSTNKHRLHNQSSVLFNKAGLFDILCGMINLILNCISR